MKNSTLPSPPVIGEGNTRISAHPSDAAKAVMSSQIEGTQSSLADLLLYEIEEQPAAVAVTLTDPPCSQWRSALSSRLLSTWPRRSGSPQIVGRPSAVEDVSATPLAV